VLEAGDQVEDGLRTKGQSFFFGCRGLGRGDGRQSGFAVSHPFAKCAKGWGKPLFMGGSRVVYRIM